jgi:hypothetical protein
MNRFAKSKDPSHVRATTGLARHFHHRPSPRNVRSTETLGTVHYRDFEDARASDRRQSLLRAIETQTPSYSTFIPNSRLGLPFKPRTFEAEYLTWPRLPELFPISFPGVKTSRDSLLVDVDRDRLERRMQAYLGAEATDAEMAELVPAAMLSSARFDPTDTRHTLQDRGFRPWQIIRYAYRPFDVRWLYWEPTTKLLDEKRSEYIKQALFPCACIATQQKCRGESSSPQLISQVGCLDLLDRGASCFPATIVDVAGSLLSQVEIRPNLSTLAAARLAEMGANKGDLFFHAVAIMHTPQYRAENKGALLCDWPRVPLPANAPLLSRSADLGRRVAVLLDADSPIHLGVEWSFLAAIKLPQNPDMEKCLQVTAGWGRRGRDSTVAPGPGSSAERPWSTHESEKIAALAAASSLTPEDALALLGETCVDVHLNSKSHWSAVPTQVWNYSLGGYQVLKKWLSYRELPLLGRPLQPTEAAHFANVVRRITAILLLGLELNRNYLAMAPTATGLPARWSPLEYGRRAPSNQAPML